MKHIWFKSYYVVWKHEIGKENPQLRYEFKSYYVVWKPIRIAVTNLGNAPFKSYYVVWKLCFFKRVIKKKIGLNRTM